MKKIFNAGVYFLTNYIFNRLDMSNVVLNQNQLMPNKSEIYVGGFSGLGNAICSAARCIAYGLMGFFRDKIHLGLPSIGQTIFNFYVNLLHENNKAKSIDLKTDDFISNDLNSIFHYQNDVILPELKKLSSLKEKLYSDSDFFMVDLNNKLDELIKILSLLNFDKNHISFFRNFIARLNSVDSDNFLKKIELINNIQVYLKDAVCFEEELIIKPSFFSFLFVSRVRCNPVSLKKELFDLLEKIKIGLGQYDEILNEYYVAFKACEKSFKLVKYINDSYGFFYNQSVTNDDLKKIIFNIFDEVNEVIGNFRSFCEIPRNKQINFKRSTNQMTEAMNFIETSIRDLFDKNYFAISLFNLVVGCSSGCEIISKKTIVKNLSLPKDWLSKIKVIKCNIENQIKQFDQKQRIDFYQDHIYNVTVPDFPEVSMPEGWHIIQSFKDPKIASIVNNLKNEINSSKKIISDSVEQHRTLLAQQQAEQDSRIQHICTQARIAKLNPILWAAQFGNSKDIEYAVLHMGCKLTELDHNGRNALLLAILGNNLENLKTVWGIAQQTMTQIELEQFKIFRGGNSDNALTLAIVIGNPLIISYCLEELGFNFVENCFYDMNAFLMAVAGGRVENVRTILDLAQQKLSPLELRQMLSAKDNSGRSALAISNSLEQPVEMSLFLQKIGAG